MKLSSKVVADELEKIRRKDPKGILRPEAVVDEARNKSHPLHDRFTWDVKEAARKRLLDEARALIRVAVTVMQTVEGPREVHAYCSLTPQRAEGGGYEHVVEVMGDDQKRQRLLADAVKELRSLQKKYADLEALAGVWSAVEGVAA